MSIQERKKYVINLHKRGYTVRQIAQELHMSSRDVIEILKESIGEENFSKSIIYLFDYRFKKVASRLILLFISTLMVVVHLSSESIHSFM